MLSMHFLNTTDRTIDGETVVDILFEEVDPERQLASMFSNTVVDLDLPPSQATEVVVDCTMPTDMDFIMFANHMHDYGSSVVTEVIRADESTSVIHEDPEWSYEMQFNLEFSRWTLDAPFQVQAGDVIRTRCTWENDTDEPIAFPREMCVGVGFFLSESPAGPVCVAGEWVEETGAATGG